LILNGFRLPDQPPSVEFSIYKKSHDSRALKLSIVRYAKKTAIDHGLIGGIFLNVDL